MESLERCAPGFAGATKIGVCFRPIADIACCHHGRDVRKHYIPFALTLAVAGCSYSYPVEAVFIRGKLHFVAEEKLNGCLNDFRVTSEAGEVMWAVEGDFRASPCEDSFPLAYGLVPRGLTSRSAAKPLKAGVLYKIEGSDGDRYYGAFRYRRQVVITNTPGVARAF